MLTHVALLFTQFCSAPWFAPVAPTGTETFIPTGATGGTGATGSTGDTAPPEPVCPTDGTLGSAHGYNVYTTGDFTGHHSDIAGRIAIGGKLAVDGYGLASKLPPGSGVVLSVGDDASFDSCQFYGGDANVLGNCTVNNLGHPSGELHCNEPTTFDAGGTDAEMKAIADWIASRPDASCTVSSQPWGQVDIHASGSPAVCTLDLDAIGATFGPEVLNGWISGLSIDAPAGATVLINVKGNTGIWGRNGAFTLSGGVDAHGILWNFDDAAALTISGVNVVGAVFAPSAALAFDNGNVDGEVVAASITGTGEFHEAGFSGNICL